MSGSDRHRKDSENRCSIDRCGLTNSTGEVFHTIMSARVARRAGQECRPLEQHQGQAIARESTCIWLCCWCTRASSFLFFVAASVSRPFSTSTSAAEPSGAAPCLYMRPDLREKNKKCAGATAAWAADEQ